MVTRGEENGDMSFLPILSSSGGSSVKVELFWHFQHIVVLFYLMQTSRDVKEGI